MKTTLAKPGHPSHLGKWEPHASMIRLVREMFDRLDEAGLVEHEDQTDVNNVLNAFLDTCPAKVYEEIREG